MQRQKIGITLRVTNAPNYPEKRDALSQEWFSNLEKINCIPICIPNTLSNLRQFLSDIGVTGFILSGGDNIGDHPERDSTERQIIDFAIASKIPVFGVCRGMQVLNKYFGGDIKINRTSEHVGRPHMVKITNPNFLDIFDGNSIQVNSFHNNIISSEILGKDLDAFAICDKDNTIEGFSHKRLPIVGVMWHPERDQNNNNLSLLRNSLEAKFWD